MSKNSSPVMNDRGAHVLCVCCAIACGSVLLVKLFHSNTTTYVNTSHIQMINQMFICCKRRFLHKQNFFSCYFLSGFTHPKRISHGSLSMQIISNIRGIQVRIYCRITSLGQLPSHVSWVRWKRFNKER